MDNFNYKKYLAEGTLLKEDKKYYSDYLEVDQNEYDNLKDRIDTEFDGNMEDFLEEFAIDFLSPNIEKINKYYGRKLSKYDVSELITENKKIGFRIPKHAFLHALLLEYQKPITSTSVNRTNHPPLNNPNSIEKEFGQEIDLLIDAGEIKNQTASKIYIFDNKTITQIR